MNESFRATKRPDHIKPPAHWSNQGPAPQPGKTDPTKTVEAKNGPTRYGDWELKGIAIDF